ncbi:hypothetical protein [Limnofasciculus baicalensis]|uniref:Uncharacterized protein n=1 Tax=Limnofasciculus baicalensis BBK-W-15 TaxID=2699891 RepID=A0AAE3KRK8_9CYAN|nr:hypothetical protein [Limnofasciculus baicalensis]MCP2728537.1 hypothetical protein [Limnofasciculus baicalensis BBK-W-15]
MLAEWYFCCCISANPSDTEAFLSILESLENPESDSQLLYLAYNELKRTEDRMQIYALPAVLKLLHRENLPAGLKGTIKRNFKDLSDLSEIVPESVKNPIHQLINLALSNQPSTKIMEAANTFAREREHLPQRRLTTTPYLDLKDFLPETLVLAIIADQLENHERLIDELIAEVNKQDETYSHIWEFLQEALEYQFGRMAFRLAALIVSLTLLEYPDRLRSLMAKEASVAAQAEPDLLQTYAIVLFRESNTRDTATSQCERIIQESLTLRELRNLIGEYPNQDSENLDGLFRRVGIKKTPNRTEGLPILYWQIALWEIAAQIDGATTAEELVKFWHPPTSLPNYLNVNCPKMDISIKVEDQFKSLFDLRWIPKKITLKVNNGTRFNFNNKYTWIFFSPWIARTQNPNNLYPRADEPALLIHLMGSVFVAIRLLQKLARDNFDQVEFAARLLAHASDAIATVERRYNKGEAPQLSTALMGLFRFTQRQIKLAGTGKFESINPEIFVKICERGQSLQEENTNINKEESLFLNRVLPEVLISWILDAYTSVVSPKLSGRWLNLIPDVYGYHIAHHDIKELRHNFPEQQKAALVTRFLCPNYSPSLDDRLNWTIERSKNKTRWEVDYRKLLLTKRLHPNEWMGAQWDDDCVDWGSDPSKISSNRLVYTLELLDAIGNHLLDYKIAPEVLEQKFSNWKDYLNSVGKKDNLNRFIRLRLLEFLDSPILENRSEEQILLASVLLEYGSIYELKNMLERVYPTAADGRTFKETGDARWELQKALLPMICNRLEKYTHLSQEINDERDPLSQEIKAQIPRETYQKLQHTELFKEWVTKLLYLSNIRENADNFSELGLDLENLHRRSLARQNSTTIRSKTLNVELRNDQKLLVFPSSEQALADLAIKAINYNPNRFTATVFYEDFDTAGVENLFKKIPAEIRTLNHESDPPLNVLAVVVDVAEIEKGEWKYTFDCGFEFLLTHSSDKCLFLQSGDRVKLPIRQFKEEDKLQWQVSHKHSIKGLAHRSLPGDINNIVVEEHWQHGRRTWSLQRQLGKETQQITDKVEHNPRLLRLWDADISRNFCQQSQPLNYKVFAKLAKLNDGEEWEPLDLDFSDLLSEVFYSKKNNNIAVLTIIEEKIGQFGETVWRFSHQPGKNYLIEQHRFLGDDAAILADAIANYQNSRNGSMGLLISVTPDFESGRVGLRLVTNVINPTEIDEFYPDLSVPFDDRNIRWRELFDRSDERLIAKKDNYGNWFFHLPENVVIPGYPDQVAVSWKNISPSATQKDADIDIIQWKEIQWRKACVEGETTPFHKIKPLKQDWADFINRWLNLPNKLYMEAGDRVKLSRHLGWIDPEGDGFIPCLTNENIRVWVQAESLTMLPLKHQERPLMGENREAEIFWIEWFEIQTRPDIKNITIPPDAIQNYQCVGIITQVPKSGTDGTQCQVVWQVSQGAIEEQGLQIDNLATLSIGQGYKIVGQQHHGELIFHIEKPNIRARALWSLKPWQSGKLDELYYLGLVPARDGNDWEIAESKSSPGQLICLPHQPKETSHLAVGKEIKSKELRFNENSIWEDNCTSNTARHRYSFDEPRSQYRRAVLKLNEQLLIGNCREWIGNEKVTVQTIELVLTQREDQKCVLRRRFNLRQIRDIKQQDTKSNADIWKLRLEDYLRKSPVPLRSTFAKNRGELGFWLSKGGDNEIQVPEDSSGKNWTLWVPLAPERGKFVMGGDYADEARICLFMEQRRVWASCRLVPPLTLAEFRVDYCEASPLNTDVFLLKDKDTRLYYVGAEEANELTGEQYAELHHRFEMGYGETLLIPESQLEFDDSSFSKAQFFLFHGDLIKVISFKTRELENSENDQTTQDVLNIKGIHLQWSEARQIYYQSSRYQIVHLLHLKPQSKDLEISYIDGFNENAIVAQQRKFEPKRFKAYLTPESQARLSDRQKKWEEDGESDPVIFGRLDKERFKRSYGKDIYFEHVRLSFAESSKGSCLLDKDLVFLSAGQIKLLKNDMGLTLKPPKGFDPEDVGKDAKSLLLLRRSFSVRENLLKQVYEEKGQNYFQDDRLLIQLTQNNEQRITSRLLIEGDSVPSRKASALIGFVSNLGKAGLLATIAIAEDRGVVQIEYKPGIFVRLQAYQIQSRSPDLPRGTIVRIEASDGKLSITRAAFGNAQYVSESIRPAVMLPTNDTCDTKRTNPEDWTRKEGFSIGGLPNIIARPGGYGNDRWDNILRSEAMTNLMATQHPKIACLGKDAKGKYRIAPPSDSFPCGRLIKIDNSLTVQYVPLNSEPIDSNNPSIPWHLLSFGDESVQQIIKRANAESWRYHDNETFTWVSDTQKFEVEKLKKHNVWTGPIFFQSFEGKLRLRYTQSEFRRFGFPVEELIYALKQPGRSHCYPIAGISKFVAGRSQSLEYSLWIELAPGRLVEIPVQLIVWPSGVNNKAKSLADLMHWQGFAPGDWVELELVSTDMLTIERIALKNWIPGVRNALGSNSCFLPVEAVDEKQGEITLCRGEFKLKLPFAAPNPNWQMAILTPENDLKGIAMGHHKRNPKRDDVVFLGINDKDQIVVLGFETMTPELDKVEADAWKNHLITGSLIREGAPKLYLNSEQLKYWISAAGGALPVTVEGLHKTENQHRLFFSMRHQQDAALILTGCISLARFVDILPDGYTAMLRCGSGLITLPMRQIIPGIDKFLYTTAAAQLKQAQVSLWLRREQNGEIKVGFSDDSENKDLFVESLDILLPKDGEGEVGLICQSIETKTLHWLPIQEAAWTVLSVAEFRDVFNSKGAFKVRRKFITRKNQVGKISIISILELPDVNTESKKLTVGQELFVKVVKKVETNDRNKERYLVESLTTQVILDCEIYDRQPLALGDTVPVEVLSHIKGSADLITVVPVGKKRKYLDLPTWMTKQLPEPGKCREQISKYMKWRDRQRLSLLAVENLESIDNSSDPIDRLLCHYFNDAYGSYGQNATNLNPEGQLKTAKQWEKQNRYKPEINAAFAIMAILLLNKHEEMKCEAYKLTQNLGIRALRSLHVEVLYQQWLNIKDNRLRRDGLWQRLRQLETDQHLYTPLKETSPDAIRQFCNAVEMRSDPELLPIANSLSAALGELSTIAEFDSHALITKKLIDLYLSLHPKSRMKELPNHHTNELQDILKQIDIQEFDIMLLEPLIYNEKLDDYSRDLGDVYPLYELFPQIQVEADWQSWMKDRIEYLEDLTNKCVSLQEKTKKLKDHFHKIHHILGD